MQEENTNPTPTPASTAQQKDNSILMHHLIDMKKHSYNDLCELSELSENELDDADDECEAVEYMLEKIMKNGTYRDAVRGIHHFIDYVHAKDALKLF